MVLRDSWNKYGETLLCVAVVLMAVAAVVWLGYEFGRLLFGLGSEGGVDLWLRHKEVQAWFRGEPVYGSLWTAVYPPASYAILWPLVGWLEFMWACRLYAFTAAAALVWLVPLLVRESGASSRLERALIGLIPLSVYATGATIGNGQIIVYIMPMLITGLLLLCRGSPGLAKDLIGSFLVAVALVKPSVAAPFLWMVLFAPGRLRPALLAGFFYLGLTALALPFQEGDLPALVDGFRKGTVYILSGDTALKYSNTNVHSWLSFFGLAEWIPVLSMTLFVGLGVWVYLHRRCDVWLLAGVAALVARFWTFHGWYDDLLVVVPLISLFRLAKSGGSQRGDNWAAGTLFGVTLLTLMAPGGLYLFPPPWNQLYVTGQTVVWVAGLVFLLVQARNMRASPHIARSLRL
jgi:hypothetical protein